MRQYNIDFFDRSLTFMHHALAQGSFLDDDYISSVANTVEISSTDKVEYGYFIHLKSDAIDFFGVVSDVSTGESSTTVHFKPFVTLFEEDFVFDTNKQGTSDIKVHPTLEATIKSYIDELYVNNEDTYQRLPITTRIDSSITQTAKWSLHLTPDTEGSHCCIVNLYNVLIVNALKKYGVVINVKPNFNRKTVELVITKHSTTFNIDGNLDNVVVKTLKYNDRPTGVNKLIAVNTENYSQQIEFYVYTDRTWGIDRNPTGKTRIVPVSKDVRGVAPDSEYEDPADGFSVAAVDLAYSTLSGLEWDNLIELEMAVEDPLIKPMEMEVGQKVSLWYKDGTYTSILTGRKFNPNGITLLFGTERIQYTKRYKRGGTR